MDGTVKLCTSTLLLLYPGTRLNAVVNSRGRYYAGERTYMDSRNRSSKPTSRKYLGGRRRYCFLVTVRRPQRFRSAGRKQTVSNSARTTIVSHHRLLLLLILSVFSIIQGAQKRLQLLAVTSSGTFIAGTGDGRILAYDNEGNASLTEGESHKNLVTGIAVQGGVVLSVGMDDTLREVEGNGQRMSCVSAYFCIAKD